MSAFTSVATKVYKDPLTTTWANTLKANDDYFEQVVAKVWARFDLSTTSTITCLASYNVANVTYNSTGSFSIGYTTGFATSDYACFLQAGGVTGGLWDCFFSAVSPTSAQGRSMGTSNNFSYNSIVNFLALGTGA